jgi:hypothetical protein
MFILIGIFILGIYAVGMTIAWMIMNDEAETAHKEYQVLVHAQCEVKRQNKRMDEAVSTAHLQVTLARDNLKEANDIIEGLEAINDKQAKTIGKYQYQLKVIKNIADKWTQTPTE